MKKISVKLLSAVLVLSMMISMVTIVSFAEVIQDGSEENPYLITCEQDLIDLAERVNSGDDCEGLYFKQTVDIELNDFVPIGYYSFTTYSVISFNGTYDGNNKEISGTIGDADTRCQGLFGAVGTEGTVKNVINTATVVGFGYTGGIVGENRGTIINCCNKGDIICEIGYNIGGIVGNNYGTVEYCYNTGDVITTSGDCVGGVAGFAGTIKNCYNTGNVTATYADKVGGVAGCVGDLIEDCYNTGSVTSETNMIGGVVGYSVGIMENCYNTGDVMGGSVVGGVAGNGYSTKNCYNTGNVSGDGMIGGILGDNAGTIENCYNAGSVTSLYDYDFAISAGGQYAKILNCYYNTDTYETDAVISGVTGKTTLEMSTEEFVDELNNGGTAFSYYETYSSWSYPYLTSFGEDSAVVSKDKAVYDILSGDSQEFIYGTDGTITFTSEGDFDKFVVLYLGDELVDESDYTVSEGSTIITLKAEYVATLSVGDIVFNIAFSDGYSTVNLEIIQSYTVTYDDGVEDEVITVPTDDTNYIKDSAVTVSTEVPTREGYTFIGWEDISTDGVVITNGEFDMPERDVTLVAQWEENSSDLPDTGNNSNIWLFIILAVLSLGGLGFVVVKIKSAK